MLLSAAMPTNNHLFQSPISSLNARMPQRNRDSIVFNTDDDLSQASTIDDMTVTYSVNNNAAPQKSWWNLNQTHEEEEQAAKASPTPPTPPQRSRSKERSSSKDGRGRGRSKEGRNQQQRSSSSDGRRRRASSREGRPRSASVAVKATSTQSRSSSKERVTSSSKVSKRVNKRAQSISRSGVSEGAAADPTPPASSRRLSGNAANAAEPGETLSSTSRRPSTSRRLSGNTGKPSTEESSSSRRRSSRSKSRERPSGSSRRLSGNAGNSSTEESSSSRRRSSRSKSRERGPSGSSRRLSGNAGNPSTEESSSSRRRSSRSKSRSRKSSEASSAAAATESSGESEIRRVNSLTAISSEVAPRVTSSAVHKVAEMYGIPEPPAPEIVLQIPSRRMPKGSIDAILSPRAGRKGLSSKPISARNLTSQSAHGYDAGSPPPKSTSSRTTSATSRGSFSTNDDKLDISFASNSSSQKTPESSKTKTTSSHGSLPLKKASERGDPPAKRPHRVRRRRREELQPPPKATAPPPSAASPIKTPKPQSGRFLELSADSPAMGLSVPRRSLSPVRARKQQREEQQKKYDRATSNRAPTKDAVAKLVATPLSKFDFKKESHHAKMNKMSSKMNDSFLNFGTDDWGCKNLGASKNSFDFNPAEMSRTSHADSNTKKGAGADSLTGKARTTHDPRWGTTTTSTSRPVVEDDAGIMNYHVDEWASDDDDDDFAKLAKLTHKKISKSSSTPALDKLKSRKSLEQPDQELLPKSRNSSTPGLDKLKIRNSSTSALDKLKSKSSSTPALDKLKSKKKKTAAGGGALLLEKPKKKKSATKK